MNTSDLGPVAALVKRSWLDTYVNKDFDITEDWIEDFWKRKDGESGNVERMEWRLRHDKMNYLVAIDRSGRIIGTSFQITLPDGGQEIVKLYVGKDYHGLGVGNSLMEDMIKWFDDDKPIELGVTTFNQRAKKFYSRWGFEEIEGSEGIKFERLPEIRMIRQPVSNKEEK